MAKDSASMVKYLAGVLSDTYLLAIKTHGFHWNVTGPLFPHLHAQFSKQYEALLEAADDLAERIRALGHFPPASAAAFLQNTAVKESSTKPLKAAAIIEELVKAHQAVRDRIESARAHAEKSGDKVSEDMLIGRLEAHDKTLWILRSQLD